MLAAVAELNKNQYQNGETLELPDEYKKLSQDGTVTVYIDNNDKASYFFYTLRHHYRDEGYLYMGLGILTDQVLKDYIDYRSKECGIDYDFVWLLLYKDQDITPTVAPN